MARPTAKPANKTPSGKTDDDDEDDDETAEGEVEIDDEDDDDEEPGEGSPPTADGRSAKRRNRYKEAEEAAAAAQRRAEEAETRAKAAEERVRGIELSHAELKGKVDATSSGDPVDAEITSLQRKKWTTMAQLQGAEDPAIAASLMQQADELDAQLAEKRMAKLESRRPRPTGPTQTQQEQMLLMAEFPWLRTHPEAARYAKGRYDLLALEPGKGDGLATAREAAREAATKYKLPGAAPVASPSAADRQRNGAPRSSALASGVGGGEGRKLVISSHMKKLAIARYPNLDEDEAIRKWAKMAKKAGVFDSPR